MFKIIDDNIEDKKAKKIVNILMIVLIVGLVLTAVLIVKNFKAKKYTRTVDAQKEAQEKAKREDDELARKGYIKMLAGEIIEVDKEKRAVAIVSDKFTEGIFYAAEFPENAEITIFRKKENGVKEGQVLSEDERIDLSDREYIQEKGLFDSIIVGQLAEIFLEKRMEPKSGEVFKAEKINIYPIDEAQYAKDISGDSKTLNN